jgi:hypothetical protein
MSQPAEIFRQHYQNYLARIAEIDLASVQKILGLVKKDGRYLIRFFGGHYAVSKDGIMDDTGKTPDYATCVILAKYLIMCPDRIYEDTQWAAFKDFKRTSHLLNVNYFSSDTERALVNAFEGRRDTLAAVGTALGGIFPDEVFSYDLVMQFDALPRISLLLLFNEGDEDFGAYGTVLFQKQAEYYLDPESLAVTSAHLIRRLVQIAT